MINQPEYPSVLPGEGSQTRLQSSREKDSLRAREHTAYEHADGSASPPQAEHEAWWTPHRLAVLTLVAAQQLSAKTLHRIQQDYPDLTAFLSDTTLWERLGLTALQQSFLHASLQERSEKRLAYLAAQHIHFLLPEDSAFPDALRKMADPPFALFVRGRPLKDGMRIAVVGTRNVTSYGKQVTTLIAGELARYGATIVSGFALGADIAAHIACVEAGGRTVGVLPGGIDDDSITPRTHIPFAQRILHEGIGTLISEYPPGTLIQKHHFLIRNRLVAALSDAIVITEGDHDSGALVTARLGIESGREVLAVPGSILFPTCRGTNTLINDGARPCRNAEDVLSALGLKNALHAKQIAETRQEIPTTPAEERVLSSLKIPHGIDELARHLGEPVAAISATISILELKGRIISVGPRTYVAS